MTTREAGPASEPLATSIKGQGLWATIAPQPVSTLPSILAENISLLLPLGPLKPTSAGRSPAGRNARTSLHTHSPRRRARGSSEGALFSPPS